MAHHLSEADSEQAASEIIGRQYTLGIIAVILSSYDDELWDDDDVAAWTREVCLYQCARCGCWVDRGQVFNEKCEPCRGEEESEW